MTADDPRPASPADLVGLLADENRRRAFAALVLGARTVAEIASVAAISARDAAASAQRLVAGGLATADGARHEPVHDVFARAMRTERRASAHGANGAGSYFRRGRLVAIPTEPSALTGVLEVVVGAFDADRSYPEVEVNALCAEWNDDWAGLRRALVDAGLLLRDRDGSRYRRATPTDRPR